MPLKWLSLVQYAVIDDLDLVCSSLITVQYVFVLLYVVVMAFISISSQILNSTFLVSACKAYDSMGNTPLHIATGNGNLAVVNFLLNKNASIDSRNCHIETPLHIAARSGNTR